MPSINKTPNFGLTQYSPNAQERISFLEDYNHDMMIIDRKLKAQENAIESLTAQVTQLLAERAKNA